MGSLSGRITVGSRKSALTLHLLATTALMGFVSPAVLPQAANAQALASEASGARSFNIPAQPLGAALNTFGRQSGMQITSAAATPRGVMSHAVSGTYTPRQALVLLLQGSGIPFTITSDRTVLIGQQISPQDLGSIDSDGSTVLDVIDVTAGGGAFANGDAPYHTAAPVSITTSQDLQGRYGGDVNQALRNTPGTFTRQSGSQPAYSVNIRGMSGYGRVANLIDGVPQTFRNAAGHGAYGGTYLYLHPEFISGIDITRGAVAGAHGSGTLSGAADFKSITIDDVLAPGENIGGIIRSKVGSNGWNWSSMAAGGARHHLFSDGSGEIRFIGAWAKTVNENYRNGDGNFMRVNVDGARAPAQNSPLSALAKFEITPNDIHKINLGYVKYENAFTNTYYDWLIDNNTYYLNYALTPDSDLFDARLNLYYNKTNLLYEPTSTSASYRGRTTNALGWGGDISNTSRFVLPADIDLKVFYGASYNVDDYSVTYRGANAPGTLKKTSAFADATFSWGMFDLVTGLRYDHYDLSGVRQARRQGTGAGWIEECPVGPADCPEEDVFKNGSQLNPKVSLVAKPLDWLQLYATYAHTFRPPTAQETFWGLVPFYDDVGTGIFNNLGLKPERSKGWDLGVNVARNGVFRADDRFRVKVGYFQNRITDYITNDIVSIDRAPGNRQDFQNSAIWVNVPGTTTMSGIEIEGSYDAGVAYANFSFTKSKTQLPYGWGVGGDVGNGDIDMLPEDYGMLDLGVRLFDSKLNLGGKLRYTGKSSFRKVIDGSLHDVPAYTLFDLYGSYNFSEHSKIFFSVENVTNQLYGLALSGDGLEDGNTRVNPTGRGRTFIAGFQTKLGYPILPGNSQGIWSAITAERGASSNVYDWTGAYVGISAGHSWTGTNTGLNFTMAGVTSRSHSVSQGIEGFNGGVFAGYNQQFRNDLVLGAEADVSISGARGGPDSFGLMRTSSTNYLNAQLNTHQKWSAGLRARAGLAFDRYLPYVSAGVSVAQYSHDPISFERGQYVHALPDPRGGGKNTVVGLSVGAGLEHAVTDRLTVRTDYRFTDYGHAENVTADGVDYDLKIGRAHDLRLGLSYKF